MTSHLETTLAEFDKEFPNSRGVFANGDPHDSRREAIKAFITSRYVDLEEKIKDMKWNTGSLSPEKNFAARAVNTVIDDILSIIRDNH